MFDWTEPKLYSCFQKRKFYAHRKLLLIDFVILKQLKKLLKPLSSQKQIIFQISKKWMNC